MKRGDLIIITSTLCVAIVMMILFIDVKGDKQTYDVVGYHGREEVFRHSLVEDEQYVFEYGEAYNELHIRNGEAFMAHANCPDKSCTYTKPISQPGQIIVCLPHNIIIEVHGKGESEIDALSQ